MKQILIIILATLYGLTASAQEPVTRESKIQLAILLDTSNSMDGLINQTKSQLWKIVNELSEARYKGKIPTLEIAIYEYGNDNLSVTSGYIRKMINLSTDLDTISSILFGLTTNGGSEYCGNVIDNAAKELNWSKNKNDLRVIYIAGNESFEQGSLNYSEAIANTKEKGIEINTIYCGNWQEGIGLKWKHAAKIGGGEYLNIDQDRKVVYIATPFDTDILQLNQELNSTYYGYGNQRKERMKMQRSEDKKAVSMGKSSIVNRALAKSKTSYKNAMWDLVDAYQNNPKIVNSVKPNELPEKFRKLKPEELAKEIEKLANKRKTIKKRLRILELKRKEHQYAESKKNSNKKKKSLDEVMTKSAKKQALKKGFFF